MTVYLRVVRICKHGGDSALSHGEDIALVIGQGLLGYVSMEVTVLSPMEKA